jgi:hypothetical protein
MNLYREPKEIEVSIHSKASTPELLYEYRWITDKCFKLREGDRISGYWLFPQLASGEWGRDWAILKTSNRNGSKALGFYNTLTDKHVYFDRTYTLRNGELVEVGE